MTRGGGGGHDGPAVAKIQFPSAFPAHALRGALSTHPLLALTCVSEPPPSAFLKIP